MDQIEEVLSKTDIVELVNSYISLKKTGRSFKALCPFHSEKTPSFVVSQELQIFKCFGCFPAGSLICGSPSLKQIEKIKVGDKVLTHKGKYQPVQLKFKREYEGILVEIETRKLNVSINRHLGWGGVHLALSGTGR